MTAKLNLVSPVQIFRDISEYFMNKWGKSRAVTISAVWRAVQNKLDEEGGVDDYGDSISSGYVLDVYFEEAGPFAIITRNDGKLYKIAVAVDDQSQIELGEELEVVMDFKPVTARSIKVQRQKDGTYRWYAMPACTAVLNRSGEIDSRELFDSFEDHVKRTQIYPELDFFHLGERLVLGIADWVARDGYTYCASGTFYDTEIARAAIASIEKNGSYWGLSIAYLPTSEPEQLRSADGVEIPVYNSGINRFISLLPESTAASILTSISAEKEVNRMDKTVKKALKNLTGENEELFEAIVDQVDSVNRSAEQDGVIKRSAKPATAVSTKTAAKPAVKTAAKPLTSKEREVSDEDIEAVLASPRFAEVLNAVVDERIEARSNTADGDEEAEGEDDAVAEGAEEEGTEEAAAAAPVAEAAEVRKLRGEVKSLTSTVTKLVQRLEGEDAEEQELEEDKASPRKNRDLVRPGRSGQPIVSGVNRTTITEDLSAIAEETLASIEG